jgi:hypothetical protein
MASPEIERLVQEIYARADQPKEITPWDYARARINRLEEGERGYRARAIAIVAKALHLSRNTVARWGTELERYPSQYGHILYKLDTLERVTDLLARTPDGQRAALRQLLPH